MFSLKIPKIDFSAGYMTALCWWGKQTSKQKKEESISEHGETVKAAGHTEQKGTCDPAGKPTHTRQRLQ